MSKGQKQEKLHKLLKVLLKRQKKKKSHKAILLLWLHNEQDIGIVLTSEEREKYVRKKLRH